MKLYFISIYLMISLIFSQDIIGENLYGEELITYLQNNYKTNSTQGYNNARDILYSQIDINNGNVFCIYTNYSVYLPSNVDPSTYLYENGMNCEHVWPQSMYDVLTTNLMKSDMHHLRPCKENVNSYRSNKSFGESIDNLSTHWLWQEYNLSTIPLNNIDEYSENGTSIFEPREDVKGDIARSMFYFYTIYEAEANDVFFEEQKQILFDWHNNDPIAENEIDRSWLIAAYQNDIPNPFILDSTLIYRAYFYTENINGDVNYDGLINIVDIILIVNYILDNSTLSEGQIDLADMNNDSIINIVDIVALMNLIIGDS